MGHYAKVCDGIVLNVIVAEESFFDDFIDTSPGKWIQTSYNTKGGVYYIADSNTPASDQSKALRKNFAGIGYTYDFNLDAFIPPKPYTSWTLNTDTCLWEPPIPMPIDKNFYLWDEQNQKWVISNNT